MVLKIFAERRGNICLSYFLNASCLYSLVCLLHQRETICTPSRDYSYTQWSLPCDRYPVSTGLPVINLLPSQVHFSLVSVRVDKFLSTSATLGLYKIEIRNDASKVSISTFRGKTKIIILLLERFTETVSYQVVWNQWITTQKHLNAALHCPSQAFLIQRLPLN